MNIANLLKYCPKGTKLYSLVHGEVTLDEVDYAGNYPIRVITSVQDNEYFDSEGLYNQRYFDGECILFPSKEQRDWSKFKVHEKRFNPEEFKPFDKVLLRDGKGLNWIPGFFEKLLKQSNGDCLVVDFRRYSWYMCISYNDETKHLLGTKEDCPEYYKWWKE